MLKSSLPTIFLLSALSFFYKKRILPQSGLLSKRLLQKSVFKTQNGHTELVEVPILATRNPKPAFFLIIFSIFFSLNSYSQDTIPRKKIGLVLSGGGAKGFAHIGVLKVLEQAGVKIDYIGGTSMGSVVGGLYASGYNATQIDSIFQNTNFDDLLKDYNPRISKSFYEKKNDEMYALTLPFDKFKIGVPLALSKGLYNYNLLNRLLKKVRHVTNFNELPIPFVCIATDIESGNEVVLNNGYLPKALLASSAFPSLFAPVEIDGKFLIDGGVTNNYPVEELRKMGAEIIIGVDVQDDLKNRQSLQEATRILVQITNLEMIKSMQEKKKLTNIYIKPDVSNYTVISFDKGKEIIKKGEEATFPFYEKLKTLGSINYTTQFQKITSDSIYLSKINTPVLNNYTRAYIIGKLGFKQNSKVSYQDIQKGINKLDATQNFSTISYALEKNNDGDNLVIDLAENKNKTFLKFGAHYDGLYKSAALINVTHKKSFFKNDVLSLDLGLGDNFRYNLGYYVDNGYYFSYGFKSRLNQFNRNISTDFSNGALFEQLNINTLNVDFLDITNQAYIQTIFAQKFLIGAGLELKYLNIKSSTLDNATSVFDKSNYGSVFGYLKYDSLDNIYFPKKGWYIEGNIHSYLFSSNFSSGFNRFSIAKGKAGFVKNFYKKVSVNLSSDAGFDFGENSVSYLDFVLGGYGYQTINNFNHFFGYDFVSLAADSFIKATAKVDFEFYKKNHINFVANFANVQDNLFSNGNWLSIPNYSGYGIGYGLESAIGPVEFYYSWSPELPKGFAWISLGFWF